MTPIIGRRTRLAATAAIPGQPAAPAEQGTQTAAPVPTSTGGEGGKILVWGDPGAKMYYYEGDAAYGKTEGGRCMIEKQAKENGLHAANKK